jgi:hypothetical protein
MKKIFIFCASMIFLAVGAKAQIGFGVKTGANFSNITNSNGGKGTSRSYGGIMVDYAISKKFALQGELVYSGQGCRYQIGEIGPSSVNQTLKLNYINIPVLAQYYIVPSFYVEAGPQIGFLVSAKQNFTIGSQDAYVNVKDDFKSTDVSAAIGAGYIFKKINLGINARYTSGISNIAKNSGEANNSVIQLGVFFKFSQKK